MYIVVVARTTLRVRGHRVGRARKVGEKQESEFMRKERKRKERMILLLPGGCESEK